MTKKKPVFAVSPGGRKHELLVQLLKADGYTACISDEQDAANADFYITPKAADPALLRERGITPIEYLGRSDFKAANGILTAEAAICAAKSEVDFAYAGCRALVTGSGCIAIPLARRLQAMGAFVTLAARSADARLRARLTGLCAPDICFIGGEYDLIFNTVPAQIFDRDTLLSLNRDTVIIDLASLPGGVDKEAARELGIAVVPALALPGKYMPATAAKLIRACVRSAIKEMVL